VRAGASKVDVERFLQLHDETVIRDRYAAHGRSYLRRFLSTFSTESILLIASVGGEDVAGVIVAFHASEAIYLYGASGNSFRNAMPNHALQWDAIVRSKARGCTSYDMWGVSAPGSTDDAMAGLYRFKHGFGRVESWLGSWDCPLSPLYPLWRSLESWRMQRRRANRAQ